MDLRFIVYIIMVSEFSTCAVDKFDIFLLNYAEIFHGFL